MAKKRDLRYQLRDLRSIVGTYKKRNDELFSENRLLLAEKRKLLDAGEFSGEKAERIREDYRNSITFSFSFSDDFARMLAELDLNRKLGDEAQRAYEQAFAKKDSGE